jgi:hypothetical protein
MRRGRLSPPLPRDDLYRPPEPDLGGEGGEEVFEVLAEA